MKRPMTATFGCVLVAAAATAAGCSTDNSPTASTATPTALGTPVTPTSDSPTVGGMTECTKEALAEPATEAAKALGADNLYTVDVLDCADGWAVTSGLLSSTDNPGMGAPTSFIFEQQGQFWVPKDKAAVCGTNPVTTTAPADAQIPAGLFLAGCAAG